MDQLKIGKFIADCRKQKNLTQMQLAEKLGITDKAISKWERGIAMPDTSINQRHENRTVSLECIVVLPYLLAQEP